MIVNVSFSDMDNSPAAREFVEEAIDKACQSFGDRLTRVEVHLRDDSSPKKSGTLDKRCTIEYRLTNRQPDVVEARENDIYQAISMAADKLKRVVQKKLSRSEA